MDNFIFSINATIPIFLVILLGWFLMKIHIIKEEFANGVTRSTPKTVGITDKSVA